MKTLSRREWVDLRSAHPGVDPADPTDEFATALLAAVGGDPEVWETGGETEAAAAYRDALAAAVRDVTGMVDLILADPQIGLMVRVAVEHGVSLDEFLSWSDRSQDAALAWAVLQGNRCPAGHPGEGMADVDAVNIRRVFCATCAKVHAIDEQFKDATADMRVGWHTEVTRVPR